MKTSLLLLAWTTAELELGRLRLGNSGDTR